MASPSEWDSVTSSDALGDTGGCAAGKMTMTDCTSSNDGDCGCGSFGVPLECLRVKVEQAKKDGFLFQGAATALLEGCEVKDCGRYGVYAQAMKTRVGFEGGHVYRNAAGGVCAEEGACVCVAQVQSSGNAKAGFRSSGRGSRVQLQSCESSDGRAYKPEKEGVVLVYDSLPARATVGKKSNMLEQLKAEFRRGS